MKKTAICLLLISLGGVTYCQQTPPAKQDTRNEFLIKSKKQKTTAWVLLGAGSAMMIVGGIEWQKNFNIFTSGGDTEGAVMLAGVPVALSSIPFFISAAKNKGRAEVSAVTAKAYTLRGNKAGIVYIPSLKITIGL